MSKQKTKNNIVKHNKLTRGNFDTFILYVLLLHAQIKMTMLLVISKRKGSNNICPRKVSKSGGVHALMHMPLFLALLQCLVI